MDSKRIAIAFGLSAAILILWSVLFPPPKPAVPPRPAGAATVASPATPLAAPVVSTAAATNGPPAAGAAGATTTAPVAVRVEPIRGSEPRDVVATNGYFTARLSNRGGVLTSLTLSRFRDGAGKPLELVPQPPFPGAMLLLDAGDPFLARAQAALHHVTQETKGLETRVVFSYGEEDGALLRRTYTFRPDYLASLKVERQGPAGAPLVLTLGPGIANPTPEELLNRYTKPGSSLVLSADGGVKRRANDAVKEPVALPGETAAAGLENNYFVTMFVPKPGLAAALRPATVSIAPKEGAAPVPAAETVAVLSAPRVIETDLYFGPKEPDALAAARPGLERVIDYGPWFIAVFVRPLLSILKWIHTGVGNWGVAILLITALIKIALFPLTHKQLVSMKKMSALQPKMETIRAKWSTKVKSDPQARIKMNEEVMALYKTEGVNPAGGCLPLLLQMPILFAFYNLLLHAIELRQAPFVLWIHDLSAKDPYYVTPVLMTLTMWLQTAMMPPTGDATMRRVQSIMPFVFGFFFKDVPSGLVLYWLTQNVLTIVQQLLLDRFTDLGPRSSKKSTA